MKRLVPNPHLGRPLLGYNLPTGLTLDEFIAELEARMARRREISPTIAERINRLDKSQVDAARRLTIVLIFREPPPLVTQ